MPFSDINIVHTVMNEHGAIFADVIDLLSDCFEQLGCRVHQSVNHFVGRALNVVVGHTAFLNRATFEAIRQSNYRYVVFQMEALDERIGLMPEVPNYLEFLRRAPRVWDYSSKNLAFLTGQGCTNTQYIPLGYSRRLQRIEHAAVKDIDVVFYGANNRRRGVVLDALVQRVRLEVLFGAYGQRRDQAIARARIVLNLHQFDTSQLEQVRLSFLLNNRCFVVSESAEGNPYGDGLVFCDYEKIAECCVSYLRAEMESERARIAEAGYARLGEIPMTASIGAELKLLAGLWPGKS